LFGFQNGQFQDKILAADTTDLIFLIGPFWSTRAHFWRMTWTWFVLTNSFQNPSAHTDVYIYSYLFIYLVGGFNPSEKYERQLG
jgi:hypothetical protein